MLIIVWVVYIYLLDGFFIVYIYLLDETEVTHTYMAGIAIVKILFVATKRI